MKSDRHWRNRETRPAGWTDQDSRSPSRRTKIFARIELIQAWMEGEESKGFAELFLHLGNFAELGQSGSFVRRSEEHTSELRHGYISYAVFCLKKKIPLPHKFNMSLLTYQLSAVSLVRPSYIQ